MSPLCGCYVKLIQLAIYTSNSLPHPCTFATASLDGVSELFKYLNTQFNLGKGLKSMTCVFAGVRIWKFRVACLDGAR